jgi:DNA polymerase-3 subunit epsilon
MKRILIIDTETTGLDETAAQVIEVAIAIYSVEHRSLVRARSWLVSGETNAAEAVNGIPSGMLSQGIDFSVVNATVHNIAVKECDAIVAHGADFDRKWFSPDVQRLPWVCSMRDLDWRRKPTSKSLVALALAYGVGVSAAHRALDDVMTLVRTFERAAELGEDIAALLARGARPKVHVVSLAPFEQKDEVKAAGFAWDAGRKLWTRKMAADDVAALPFAVRIETKEGVAA